MSLLPPNSTKVERGLERAMLSGIDLSDVGTLWNPATCPEDVLPFLAWGISIAHWDTTWSVAQKRAAIAQAIAFHRIKGTRAAVQQVLDRFNPLLQIVEWHQQSPKGAPHTFQVRADMLEIAADFLTPETAQAIIADVAAAKPLRAHFDFVQSLETQATLYLASGGMAGAMWRTDLAASHDTSRDWSLVLQSEDGEPILTEDGTDYLETA